MLTEREEMIVRWLRERGDADWVQGAGDSVEWTLREAANLIEAGEHLKRPSPTIPFEQWKDEPSVGYGEVE